MSSAARPASPAYAWYVVGVMLLAYTLSFIDRMILSLLVGPIKADLGISDTQMSLLMGFAFAIFYSALGIPLGWVADRRPRRGLIVAGIAAWSLMTAACALARGYVGLFLARIGVGVGEATLSPAVYSMLGDYFPREKLGRAMAVYSIGVPLGSGIALMAGSLVVKIVTEGPPVALPIVGELAPWRLTFLWVGLPGLLVALLVALTVREPPRQGDASKTARGEFVAFLRSHPAAIASHFGGMSLIALVMYGAMAWIPQFLHRTYAMPVPEAGLWFGVATATCGAAGLLIGGWLADRLYRRGFKDAHLRVIRLNAILLLPLFVGMALAPTAGLALWMMVVAMLVGTIHGGVAGARPSDDHAEPPEGPDGRALLPRRQPHWPGPWSDRDRPGDRAHLRPPGGPPLWTGHRHRGRPADLGDHPERRPQTLRPRRGGGRAECLAIYGISCSLSGTPRERDGEQGEA
ncbi:MFS transporter [Phenylobacterium sp. J367]|uniref:spinster family MFS transporter n=1 Tax=Phenylobacterium sp. J367 TaxID=2898435 RepID=UPI0021510867|nr:MFS transporter [Phenylobacterium sp. J367]MCR5879841.1 MFS transporter [Phenylobacterium sp. J367]